MEELTHFVKAREAGGHGGMFGGLAQIWSAGRPHFASLAQRLQPAGMREREGNRSEDHLHTQVIAASITPITPPPSVPLNQIYDHICSTSVCRLHTYLSSPPTLSFWCVELGPQVRPFFLLLDRSSFLHTALRPHVLLPSVGVTGGQEAQ